MNDTPADVAAAFTALVMRRSEGERVMMAFEMFDLARALMTADIRARDPGISESELRVQIFERTYGSDFDETDRARIAQRIRGEWPRAHPSGGPLFHATSPPPPARAADGRDGRPGQDDPG